MIAKNSSCNTSILLFAGTKCSQATTRHETVMKCISHKIECLVSSYMPQVVHYLQNSWLVANHGCHYAGASPDCSLWQQMNVLLVLRQLISSPMLVHYLFVTYDLKQVRPICLIFAIDTMQPQRQGHLSLTLSAADHKYLYRCCPLLHSAGGVAWCFVPTPILALCSLEEAEDLFCRRLVWMLWLRAFLQWPSL